MRSRLFLCTALIAAATGVIVANAQEGAQQADQAAAPEMNPEMAKMMEIMKTMTAVGEHHRKLDQFVGEWTVTTRMWMGGPGTPAQESSGTASVKWILNGKFLQEDFKSTFMGQPFQGMGLLGYDNYKNMYVHNWLDSHGTHMLRSKGSFDQSGMVLTMYGEMDEPMLGVQDRLVKYVTRIINENKHVFEMYDLHAGDDYKVFEIVYVRQ